MARLPTPGSDANQWGDILNDFLRAAHNADGTLKDTGALAAKADDTTVVHTTGSEAVSGTKTFTNSPVIPAPTLGSHAATKAYVDDTAQPLNSDLTAISNLTAADDTVLQRKTGAWTARTPAQLKADLTLSKADVGLANVDNTSDAAKNSAVATLTNKTISGTENTLINIPQTAVTGLVSDLASKTTDANLYVQSRAQNLITNGSGLLGNNYNFSGFTFDPAETYSGGGSFLVSAARHSRFNDELIPVDPSQTYTLSGWAKSGDTGGANFDPANRQYFGLAIVDIDGTNIDPSTYAKYPGSTDTTLAAPLNPGDTTVTLTDATGWYNGATATSRQFAWYGYTNSKGYTYPDYTYTRTVSGQYSSNSTLGTWEAGGISGNIITLRVPWAGPALAAGAAIRNNLYGGTYKYMTSAGNTIVPNEWTFYSGRIGGIDVNGTQASAMFPYGTAFVRLMFLVNYHNAPNNIRWSNLSFSSITAHNLEAASTTGPGIVTTGTQTFAGIKTFSNIVTGSLAPAITTKTSNAILTSTEHTVLCDATSGNITLGLNSAANLPGWRYVIKKIDSTANTVTIDASASQLIDGALTQVITTQWEKLTIQSDGANWFIV